MIADFGFQIGTNRAFVGDFGVGVFGRMEQASNIFPVLVSCEIESGLENSEVFGIARTPFFVDPLGGGVCALEPVSIRRERFGPANYE